MFTVLAIKEDGDMKYYTALVESGKMSILKTQKDAEALAERMAHGRRGSFVVMKVASEFVATTQRLVPNEVE